MRSALVEAARARPVLSASVALTLLVGAVFGGALPGEFVWDDVMLVRDNEALVAPGGLGRLLTQDLWGGAGQEATQLYHPLPMLTLWLQARLHGVSMVPLRAFNVALHVGVVVLAMRLLLRLGLRPASALAAAAVFAVHPLVTEPVMWLTGRHDTMAALFSLAALLVFPRPDDARSWLRAGAAGALAAAAFASKEPYVVVPALLALLLRHERGAATREAIPLLAPSVVGVGAVFGLRSALGISSGSAQVAAPLLTHLQTYGSLVAHYLGLGVTLSEAPTISSYRPLALGPALLVCVVTALAAVVAWRAPGGRPARAAGLGALWFCVTLAPHVVSTPIIGLWGNRYGYFPLLGGALALAAALDAAAGLPVFAASPSRAVRSAPLGVAAVAVLLGAWQTRAATRHWADDLALYTDAVERDPTDGRALYHQAYALQKRVGCEGSVQLFAKATELDPTYPRALRNLAGCYLNLRQPALAVPPARRAVELEPHVASHRYNLGAALVTSGDLPGGAAALREALRLDPGHAKARALLDRVEAHRP